MNKIMRSSILIVAILIGTLSIKVIAQEQSIPLCFMGLCLDGKELPTENAIRDRFGGRKQVNTLLKQSDYCYRFVSPQQVSYGHFVFKDGFDTGLRLVTIRSSKEPLCANAHIVKLKRNPSTKEGIQLNSEEVNVLKHYGQPSFTLRPPPSEVIRDFFGDPPNGAVDSIDQYTSRNNKNPSSARFYISNGRVVGVELSVDE